MISLKPTRIAEEIRAGLEKKRLYLVHQREILSRYHGPGFLQVGEAYTDHENHAYEWIARYSAELIQANPRAVIKGHTDKRSELEGEQLEQAANRDIRHSDIRRLMQDTFPDWATFWHVTITTSEPALGETGRDNPLYGPCTADVDHDDWFADATAKRVKDIRLCGHRVVCDKEDLLQRAKDHPEEGWDPVAISQLKPRGNLRSSSDGEDNGLEDNFGRSVERGEVEYWEVFIDQTSKKLMKSIPKEEQYADNGDSLYNGTLCTISFEVSGKSDESEGRTVGQQLRPPRPYFGPPSDETAKGPYVLHGCHRVSKHLYPMGPVLATYHQQRALNEHVDRMLKHSKNARSFDAVDGLNTDDNELLKNAQDGSVQVVNGIQKDRVVHFEYSGTTQEDVTVYEILKSRRDENSGLGQPQRGNPAAGVTATADAIAGSASDARKEYCAQRLVDGWRAVIRQRVWFLRNDFRVCFHLEDGALFLGGYQPEKALRYAHARKMITDEEADFYLQPQVLQALQSSRVPWSELDLEIDIFSLQRTNELVQQRRVVDGNNALLEAAPLMPQAPYIDWKMWAQKLGEGLNYSDFGEILKPEILAAYAQALMQAQQNAQQGPPQGAVRSPQPGGSKPAAAPAGGPPGQQPQQGSGRGFPGNKSGSQAGAAVKAGGA